VRVTCPVDPPLHEKLLLIQQPRYRYSFKVPLPDGFFSTPPLSDNLRHEYIRQSQRSLVDFVAKTRLRGGPISWTFDHEHHGVTVYRGKDMHLPSGYRTVYLNVTEVQATLDEAASIMSAGADGRRDYCATYHNDQVVDLKNLYPLATPTPSHPHNSISIKWRAVTANNPLIKLRDMVFIEVYQATAIIYIYIYPIVDLFDLVSEQYAPNYTEYTNNLY
ncbi:hypothetical protein DYB38_013910, partial [Aphanomyces astaci]